MHKSTMHFSYFYLQSQYILISYSLNWEFKISYLPVQQSKPQSY